MSVLIEASGLRLARGPQRQLALPDFALHEGERLCLVGPSGRGKTSLLHALLTSNWALLRTLKVCHEPGGFHTLTILSMPEEKSVPSGVRHRLATVSRWPCIVPRHVPSFQSHTLMMLSTAHE